MTPEEADEMSKYTGTMSVGGKDITGWDMKCNHTRHYLLHRDAGEDEHIFNIHLEAIQAQYCPQCGVKLEGDNND